MTEYTRLADELAMLYDITDGSFCSFVFQVWSAYLSGTLAEEVETLLLNSDDLFATLHGLSVEWLKVKDQYTDVVTFMNLRSQDES